MMLQRLVKNCMGVLISENLFFRIAYSLGRK